MKRILPFVCLVLVFMMFGCSQNKIEYTAIKQIEQDTPTHKSQLHDYDSPYTICYEDKDGTYSMYIFASPIQYRTSDGYAIINNTIIKSTNKDFAFENKSNEIKTFFPKDLSKKFLIKQSSEYLSFSPDFDVTDFSDASVETITNMYKDTIQAVVYKSKKMNLCFYPTKAGIKLEIVLKEKPESNAFRFSVQTSSDTYENKENGYLLFKNAGNNCAVIYSSLMKGSKNNLENFSLNNKLDITGSNNQYQVTMKMDESLMNSNEAVYPVRLDPSFELYQNKMPDSSIYSKFSTNSYLSNYTVLGEHPDRGEGWHYIRFRMQYFMTLSSEQIINATYYAKCLYMQDSQSSIEVLKNNEQWSSTNISWDKRSDNSTQINSYKINNGLLPLDITSFSKECFSDSSMKLESMGVVLKSQSDDFFVLSTSDNSMDTPYIKLELKSLPKNFEQKQNINQDLNKKAGSDIK